MSVYVGGFGGWCAYVYAVSMKGCVSVCECVCVCVRARGCGRGIVCRYAGVGGRVKMCMLRILLPLVRRSVDLMVLCGMWCWLEFVRMSGIHL